MPQQLYITINHDKIAFATVSHLTVGDFRNWLLAEERDSRAYSQTHYGGSSLRDNVRNQDQIRCC
ncbi:MAG: ethanolamine ammonia-lyase subunit EutB [Chloroflexi bacterium]|uniref:Ethanolamine ammonia-lyase subunit EutB n=1 Tax=Candidatus Chlorohelix allophototropha TaxID=3003348 RepID=A0A8T7M3Y1_9CHLR|nr:ethanolamine ammonia-lyase subunit EutB [Chloroflexota bacterium]